jgi:hypothetical protein
VTQIDRARSLFEASVAYDEKSLNKESDPDLTMMFT